MMARGGTQCHLMSQLLCFMIIHTCLFQLANPMGNSNCNGCPCMPRMDQCSTSMCGDECCSKCCSTSSASPMESSPPNCNGCHCMRPMDQCCTSMCRDEYCSKCCSTSSTRLSSSMHTTMLSPSTPINPFTSAFHSTPASKPTRMLIDPSSSTFRSTPASSPTGSESPTSSFSSAPINLPNSHEIPSSIIASVIVIIAITVIAAIVIILMIFMRRKKKPLQSTTDGMDNMIYSGAPPHTPMTNFVPMTAVNSYAAYEPLKDKVEQGTYDYLEEDCSPYIIPACHEEELYVQLDSRKLKKIPRHQIEATERLGSGQFGEVQIGTWNGSKGRCEVAIKTLNPTITQPDAKVKFLQEAAIMAQFRHPNVIQLHGIVTYGEPVMLVLELAHKGDLRTHLNTLKPDPGQLVHQNLNLSLFAYSKEIADGMKYLSNKSFVHRDLAARNILVTQNCTCKISDFGLSRDLADDTYYVSRGGMIPIKWTAPEAIHFKKYSTASDVWSYGCLLYEIWSMGVKPFEGKSNANVVQMVDSGYRLSPPPGCPYLVYQLMIQCWNPETHSRPTFRDIYLSLCQCTKFVLQIPDDVLLTHPQAGILGAPLEAGENMYIDLQKSYV